MGQETRDRPVALVDSNVLFAYYQGWPPVTLLFGDDILGKIQLAINPIIIQELFLHAGLRTHPELVQQLQEKALMLPVNPENVRSLFSFADQVRDGVVNSNDILILNSARECDFLVTYDQVFRHLLARVDWKKPRLLTPEELLTLLGPQ